MKSYRNYELKNNVRALRVAIGLTQIDLARIIGTTQNTISSLERNEYQPTAYLAALLCETFQVPFDTLFYFEYEGVRANAYSIEVNNLESRMRHFQYLRNEAEFLKMEAALMEDEAEFFKLTNDSPFI